MSVNKVRWYPLRYYLTVVDLGVAQIDIYPTCLVLQCPGIPKRNTSKESFEYDITSLCARQAGEGAGKSTSGGSKLWSYTEWSKITTRDIYHVMGSILGGGWHVFKLTHPHDGRPSIKAVPMFKRE
jgi:hypothetical protein